MLIVKNLQGKKIAILGLGIENLALIKYLLKHKLKCEITICDARNKKELGKKYDELIYFRQSRGNNQRLLRRSLAVRNDIKWQLSKNYNKNFDKFDVLFRSPGWPIAPIAETQCMASLQSAMKLFFELCPTKNIIGITGAKGKGTTASLIYEILKKHFSGETRRGASVYLGGNIGVAPFDFIDKIKKTDWVVLELSSFQLEDLAVSPRIAVITNFYPEHLAPADPNNPNFHKSMKEYWQAKANIFRWQKSGDYLISKSQIPISQQIPNPNFPTKGKKIYFKKSELPSKLIGEHNKENIAAAVEVAKIVGVKPDIIKKVVTNFKGLEHRLEFVRELNGVKYYDDSFATTPETAITALESFSQLVIILLGGADKAADFSQLAQEVKKRCKFVILLNGQATPRIKKELLQAGYKKNKIKLFNNINEAVKFSNKIAVRGDVVLLSTACASFGMFKNYKERGNLFKAAAKSLK